MTNIAATNECNFDDLGLREKLLRGIYAYGFERPLSSQALILEMAMLGRHVCVQAHSGIFNCKFAHSSSSPSMR